MLVRRIWMPILGAKEEMKNLFEMEIDVEMKELSEDIWTKWYDFNRQMQMPNT